MKDNDKMYTQRKEHLNFRGNFHQTTFVSHSLSNTQIPIVMTCYYETRNAFCGTWYLSHSLIHNGQTVPIIIARCIAHARNSHISTSGQKSGPTKSRPEPSGRRPEPSGHWPDAARMPPASVEIRILAWPSRYHQQPQVLVSLPLDDCWS